MTTDREQLYLYVHRKKKICLLRIKAALPVIRRETTNVRIRHDMSIHRLATGMGY